MHVGPSILGLRSQVDQQHLSRPQDLEELLEIACEYGTDAVARLGPTIIYPEILEPERDLVLMAAMPEPELKRCRARQRIEPRKRTSLARGRELTVMSVISTPFVEAMNAFWSSFGYWFS